MRFILLLICLSYSISAAAQFNDSTHHYVNYTSTGSINKTNENHAYLLSNFLKFNMNWKRLLINTSNSWIYGQQQSVETNNDFSSSVDINLLRPGKPMYYWALGNYDKSLSLKINNRVQAGLGIAYNVINNKNALIVLSDGFLYEAGDLTDPELGNVVYHTWRNSARIKFKWVSKREIFEIDGSDFYQPSLSDRHDYIIKSVTNLNIKLKKWLSFTTSVSYNKLNKSGRENLLITYGLKAERYF